MGIALLTMSAVYAPLQSLLGWFVAPGGKAHVQRAPRRAVGSRPAWVQAPQHCGAQYPVAQPVPARALPRPLRVLRVLDPNQTTGGTGRLVISGRMIDVCAELDRLASSEGARH